MNNDWGPRVNFPQVPDLKPFAVSNVRGILGGDFFMFLHPLVHLNHDKNKALFGSLLQADGVLSPS